jgi:hypothetical protein
VDRPVYIDRPIQTPVFASVAQNFGGCSVAAPQVTIAQPTYGHGCHGATTGAQTPIVSGGYEYHGNSFANAHGGALGAGFGNTYGTSLGLGGLGGFGSLGGYGGHDCCTSFGGGHYGGFGGAVAAHHRGHSPVQHLADRISKISARIADGENVGRITQKEAASLRSKIQKISNNLDKARKDGKLNNAEIEKVAASVRTLDSETHNAKANASVVHHQYGYGFGGINPYALRPDFGAASAYLPSAQFPHLQQALPAAYGFAGFGGAKGKTFGDF